MSLRSRLISLAVGPLISFAFITPLAKADALSIVYASSQNQIATVGPGFTTVLFAGYVVNNTNAPITFQLTGGPTPFEPFVASFINGIGYPGITLAGGQSTGRLALATVNLNPFDPSLTYPGLVNIVLDAISVDPATGRTGGIITENDASIRVQTAVPEPSTLFLLTSAFLAALFLYHRKLAQDQARC
jgi:hypothetical protein